MIIALMLALFVRSFVVEAFSVPSGSMTPTLLAGDYLLVNRLSYVVKAPFTDLVLLNLGDPKPGDTVVFRYPMDHSKDFVKRVVAIGGDTVEIRDKALYVNGKRVDIAAVQFTSRQDLPSYLSPRDNHGPVTVPAGSCFVMGDNRDDSLDSRLLGVREERRPGRKGRDPLLFL